VRQAAADWVTSTADDVCAEAGRRHPGEPATCASGISPSGAVHLGNFRELMVPHLVADEIARRGLPVRHILSWDDYDRLRKVPAGLPRELAEHIGRPLTAVPDPCGGHESWAEHFKAPLRTALAELGIEVTEISQTRMYTSGAYTEQIVLAMRRRAQIAAVLARFRTRRRDSTDEAAEMPAAGEEYYPFRPYCAACGRDDTTVTGFDDETTELSYTCACGGAFGPLPIAQVAGKLAWKVDWPMRWAYERVTFEPAGVDHASPGSSFTVGGVLVREVFDAPMPLHFGYSFVGTSGGSSKLSGSAGGAPTPAEGLQIFEPPLLRWLYARRQPAQSITLAFGSEVLRVYDEWDALARAVRDGRAAPRDAAVYRRSAGTAAGLLPVTPRILPFRALASVADITAGDPVQLLRILRDMTASDPAGPVGSLDEVRPRLDRAQAWVTGYAPEADRTHVRSEPDLAGLADLTAAQREAVKLLLDGLAASWSLDGLTALLYGIPKVQAGLPADAPATAELKTAQRAWFTLLYRLLVGADTGPRLPTLVLALGQSRVRELLGAG
jgi:lysyl-tRNA synthetase class 1